MQKFSPFVNMTSIVYNFAPFQFVSTKFLKYELWL